VKNIDDGTSDHPYSHALVAGIDRYPPKWQLQWARRKSPRGQRSSLLWKFVTTITLCPQGALDLLLDNKTVVNKNVFRDPALKCKAKREAQVKFKDNTRLARTSYSSEASVLNVFCCSHH
jgi:large subunit ribosomal protein L27e